MKNVCLVAYQIQFGKGSEFGSGYEIAYELVKEYPNATIISRKKNIFILKDNPHFAKCNLIGFDVPHFLGFYKRKAKGLTPYYFTWLYLVSKIVKRNAPFDIIHLINFHSDVYPHFFNNPDGKIIWGPIAHHPFIPKEMIYRTPTWKHVGMEYGKILAKYALWYSPLMKKALQRSETIFCCNPKDIPPSFKRYQEKIQYLNMVARPFDIQDTLPPDPQTFQILFIGRFLDMKGTVFALETFHSFLKTHPDSHLTMIGKGPLKERLENYIAKQQLENNVDIVSWIPQDDLLAYYQKSHVFLFPSMESQGLVITESMQFGLPIVCLEGYGPHSLAREAALTVPYQKNAKEQIKKGLLQHLTHLYEIRNTKEYLALRKRTRETFDDHLAVPKMVDQIRQSFL